MRPHSRKNSGQFDLFRCRLDQIINMHHPLAQLTQLLDWEGLEKAFSFYYAELGRPGLAIRLILGLHLLKYIYALSDEEVCARWEENPYFQYFSGEEFFQHRFPIERSSMSHFRNRIPADILEKVLQESLAAAHGAGALSLKDLRQVVVDTTVQEKAIAHPTDHGLMLKTANKLGQLARTYGLKVRQSYQRVMKKASIQVGRYVHAKQFRRAKKQLKFMRTRLGRLIRDVERKAKEVLSQIPRQATETLRKAKRIYEQKRGDKGYLYSWHAPEVECISKGKARKPYEFGCKVSLATQLKSTQGRHFILQAQAVHKNPYDGHTLSGALEQLERIIDVHRMRTILIKGTRAIKSETGV